MHQKARTIEIKQMSETSKTKPKNETKTEQNITVAGKTPTAGQRAVHFRALVIIGVAAACGLSVCAHLCGPRSMHCACTPSASCNSWRSLALVLNHYLARTLPSL